MKKKCIQGTKTAGAGHQILLEAEWAHQAKVRNGVDTGANSLRRVGNQGRAALPPEIPFLVFTTSRESWGKSCLEYLWFGACTREVQEGRLGVLSGGGVTRCLSQGNRILQTGRDTAVGIEGSKQQVTLEAERYRGRGPRGRVGPAGCPWYSAQVFAIA